MNTPIKKREDPGSYVNCWDLPICKRNNDSGAHRHKINNEKGMSLVV